MRETDTYVLSEGESCSIAPGWGCNMFSWVSGGEELMYCPEDLPHTAQKITGGGNPILFPSVGRTWDHSSGEPVPGNYRICGREKTYFMPSHGVLFMNEFEKTDERRNADSIRVAYETRVPERVREENYPFDLRLVQSYTLRRGAVDMEATITNLDSVPAPCAFGYHPYFSISNPHREGVSVSLPDAKQLLLTPKTVMLTGESEPTTGEIDLEAGIYYDLAFGEPTGTRMSLMDRNAGRAIHVDFDERCELFFLYSPDGSEFVCIEPWTRGLGAYERLKEPGWEDGKLIPVLQPGESVSYRAKFSVS